MALIHDAGGSERRRRVRGGALPSSVQTPGNKGKANDLQVCAADFEASLEPIARWQRHQALARCGQRPEDFTGELDHLIPLSLGGSNDADNIWPLPGHKEMGRAQKRELDAKRQRLVCDETLKLRDAQDAIRKDWVKASTQHVKNVK